MSQTLRQIRGRVKSIENIRKITRAMEMVAASKLNRVKTALHSYQPYYAALELMLKRVASDAAGCYHPLLVRNAEEKRIALLVVASDTGLCGTYNIDVIRAAQDFLKGFSPGDVQLITIGKEAYSHFTKSTFRIEHSFVGLQGRHRANLSDEITELLTKPFLAHEVDAAYIAYMHFSSTLRHTPVVEKYLNIEFGKTEQPYFLYEPDRETLLEDLVTRYATGKMRLVLLNAFTSEHAARMLAMKRATDNAEDLIDTLTLLRNKIRQYAITKEVLEIAMSAEALKD